MKYAVISDVHGNLSALQAVIEDAEKNNVDEYIFAGDYYCDFPFPNEVVELIKGIKNSHVIKGNKENYLVDLAKSDQSEWIYNQFAPLYWNYKKFKKENLQYLINLPEEKFIKIPDTKKQMQVFHASSHLFKSTKTQELSSSKFAEKMIKEKFTHEQYLDYVNDLLSKDEKLENILDNVKSDVIIFGHSHVQWYTKIRNKIIINSGSCGLPLDYNKGAAYTLIKYKNEEFEIVERRVPYDINDTIKCCKKSELYQKASIWCNIIIKQLELAKDEIVFFFRHVEEIANVEKNYKGVYDNEVWEKAGESWE